MQKIFQKELSFIYILLALWATPYHLHHLEDLPSFNFPKGRVVIIFKASHTRRLTLLGQLLEPATTSFKIHSNSLRSQQGVGENNIKTANYIYNLTAVRFILIIELSTLDKMTQSGNCEKCFQNCQHQNLAAVTRI